MTDLKLARRILDYVAERGVKNSSLVRRHHNTYYFHVLPNHNAIEFTVVIKKKVVFVGRFPDVEVTFDYADPEFPDNLVEMLKDE